MNFTQNGVYSIDPDGLGSFNVSCDMATDGGGWTVFQRRQDGSVDFYRNWTDYKNGFGNMSGEFWLGLENIKRLTKDKDKELRVDLEDFEGEKRYAKYETFKVEGGKYNLNVEGYSGECNQSMVEVCLKFLLSKFLFFCHIIFELCENSPDYDVKCMKYFPCTRYSQNFCFQRCIW